MFKRRRLRHVLLASALLAPVVTVPLMVGTSPSAMATVCGGWQTQADLVNADPGCRATYIVDPGPGHLLSRNQILAARDVYRHYGFSRQWLWYAPVTSIGVAGDSGQRWTYCPTGYHSSGVCSDTAPFASSVISSLFNQHDVTLDVFAWDNRFIGRGCGNTSIPNTGSDPIPRIAGHKFDDANRNGVQDGDEHAVEGIDFQLTRTSSEFGDQDVGDTVLDTVTSDASGNFAFALDDMGPGTYRVHELPSSEWVSTTGLDQTVVVPAGSADHTVATLAFGNRAEHPPVADAGPDQAVDQTKDAGANVVLDGSNSHDPDALDELEYTWTWDRDSVHGVKPTVTLSPGTHTVTLTVSDGRATSTDTMTVTVYPPITATPTTVQGTEGIALSDTVASFTDPDPDATADEYGATVDWGDGQPAASGTITKGDDGTFAVHAGHTYAEEGTFPITVTITDADNEYNTATAKSAAQIADAPLHAEGVDTVSVNPVDNLLVATFTDRNPAAPVDDFAATIDWGDGTTPSAGAVSGSTGGPFAVRGSHTYATLGPKTIKVHIVDEGGQTADAETHLTVYLPSNFVVGDRSASGQVTFWGAQWSKVNVLSGGEGPAAFKGFANGATPRSTAWTADPGNSSKPPQTIPTYMSVRVAAHVEQNGSTISGDTPQVVIVKTDAGYDPNPGHSGTGTVVATVR